MKQNSNFMFVFALVLNLWSINANALEHICNRWNVLLDNGFVLGPIYGDIWTDGYKLQGDTTINNMHYSCLQFADGHKSQQSESGDWVYHGAIRETANAEVYFVPSGQSKEYLLFAFNAQVGDKIENLYVMNEDYNTWAIVKNITEEEIILDLYEQFDENENIFMHDYVWVKGVGAKRSMFQPLPNGEVGGNVVNFLLCAYKNGEQIYVSEKGEKYGCEYHADPIEVSITQASTWYGIRYFHEYPQKEYTPLITNLTYSLGSDTVIDGKLYRQIRYTHEYEHITNAYRGAIRQSEDGQQVYYIPWGSNNEYLLYNFDVKQGDIVHAYAGFNDISCEEMAEPGRSIIPAWTVMSVQTIDGRKHIFVQDEEYGTTIEWIEGIGTQYILWPFGRTCYATGLEVQFHHTLCAADNEGNILYSFNTDDLGIRNECPNWDSADTTSHTQPSAWCMVNDPDEGGKDVTMSGLVYIGTTPCGLDSSAGPCVPCITLVFETNGHMYFLSTEDPVINTRLDSILYELESVNCICGQPVILSGSMHYGEFYDYIYARELLIKGKFQSIDYPYPETPDTVALYARVKDSPGSSTVDPVDPNQIVALLTDNRLIVYEYLGESIFYSLNKADYRPNHMPANERNVRADSFSGSVYFHLIESGRYTLELSNPRWDYLITGSFDYQTGEQGTEETPANDVRCTKVLIDGQLYIRQGDKTYTLTGIQVK